MVPAADRRRWSRCRTTPNGQGGPPARCRRRTGRRMGIAGSYGGAARRAPRRRWCGLFAEVLQSSQRVGIHDEVFRPGRAFAAGHPAGRAHPRRLRRRACRCSALSSIAPTVAEHRAVDWRSLIAAPTLSRPQSPAGGRRPATGTMPLHRSTQQRLWFLARARSDQCRLSTCGWSVRLAPARTRTSTAIVLRDPGHRGNGTSRCRLSIPGPPVGRRPGADDRRRRSRSRGGPSKSRHLDPSGRVAVIHAAGRTVELVGKPFDLARMIRCCACTLLQARASTSTCCCSTMHHIVCGRLVDGACCSGNWAEAYAAVSSPARAPDLAGAAGAVRRLRRSGNAEWLQRTRSWSASCCLTGGGTLDGDLTTRSCDLPADRVRPPVSSQTFAGWRRLHLPELRPAEAH